MRKALIWFNPYGLEAVRHKLKSSQKMHFWCFLGHFWAYVGQPHDHMVWVTSMPFTSINSTNPKTSPWNFGQKILRIGGAGKWHFVLLLLFLVIGFLKKMFCFFSMNITMAFIWGSIYFCTMEGFFKILKKALSELICTRLKVKMPISIW